MNEEKNYSEKDLRDMADLLLKQADEKEKAAVEKTEKAPKAEP